MRGDVGSYKLFVGALIGTPEFADNQGRRVTVTFIDGVLTITIHQDVSIPNVIPLPFDCLTSVDKEFTLNNRRMIRLLLSIEGRTIGATNYSF